MPNGKSPGTDGFPAEFYKVFWIDLKDILLSCYVAAFRTGKMSISQRRGIITLIPKNSVPFLLKNWRPISLLNTDYKIATRCIASRGTLPTQFDEDDVIDFLASDWWRASSEKSSESCSENGGF